MSYEAEVTSTHVEAGRSEFGSPLIIDVLSVIVTNQRGRRFQHEARFPTAYRAHNEDGFQILVPIDGAFEEAQRLADRVNAGIAAGRRLSSACWREIDPAYGSDEYVAQGIEAERAWADTLDK